MISCPPHSVLTTLTSFTTVNITVTITTITTSVSGTHTQTHVPDMGGMVHQKAEVMG